MASSVRLPPSVTSNTLVPTFGANASLPSLAESSHLVASESLCDLLLNEPSV